MAIGRGRYGLAQGYDTRTTKWVCVNPAHNGGGGAGGKIFSRHFKKPVVFKSFISVGGIVCVNP
jgi:hypothetical protein